MVTKLFAILGLVLIGTCHCGFYQKLYLFHKKVFHIATLSFMPLGNHQATDTKKNEITTVVLKSTNPYLPDRVEFKHQFVEFKAGRGI